MTVTAIECLGQHAGENVTPRGWVHYRTSKGKLHFVTLRDGPGFVQCVILSKAVDPDLFEAVGSCGQESSVELVGVVTPDERAPGGFEVKVSGGR